MLRGCTEQLPPLPLHKLLEQNQLGIPLQGLPLCVDQAPTVYRCCAKKPPSAVSRLCAFQSPSAPNRGQALFTSVRSRKILVAAGCISHLVHRIHQPTTLPHLQNPGVPKTPFWILRLTVYLHWDTPTKSCTTHPLFLIPYWSPTLEVQSSLHKISVRRLVSCSCHPQEVHVQRGGVLLKPSLSSVLQGPFPSSKQHQSQQMILRTEGGIIQNALDYADMLVPTALSAGSLDIPSNPFSVGVLTGTFLGRLASCHFLLASHRGSLHPFTNSSL